MVYACAAMGLSINAQDFVSVDLVIRMLSKTFLHNTYEISIFTSGIFPVLNPGHFKGGCFVSHMGCSA